MSECRQESPKSQTDDKRRVRFWSILGHAKRQISTKIQVSREHQAHLSMERLGAVTKICPTKCEQLPGRSRQAESGTLISSTLKSPSGPPDLRGLNPSLTFGTHKVERSIRCGQEGVARRLPRSDRRRSPHPFFTRKTNNNFIGYVVQRMWYEHV